jgi:hypothetical protein
MVANDDGRWTAAMVANNDAPAATTTPPAAAVSVSCVGDASTEHQTEDRHNSKCALHVVEPIADHMSDTRTTASQIELQRFTPCSR